MVDDELKPEAYDDDCEKSKIRQNSDLPDGAKVTAGTERAHQFGDDETGERRVACVHQISVDIEVPCEGCSYQRAADQARGDPCGRGLAHRIDVLLYADSY